MVVRADLAHELAVYQYRECLVALADEHGGAEVGEHPHEYQQGAGKHGGHYQGDDNLHHPLECGAAQAFRRLVQGIVQVLKRARDIHVNQREGLEGEYKHNACKPVDASQLHMEQPVEDLGEEAVPAQQLDPCVGADEGR